MVFFMLLNPPGENSDEETPDKSVTVPRKVHYRNLWEDEQDAVYWVNLAHAHDQGFKNKQTKSNAVGMKEQAPANCIYSVTSLKGKQIQNERASTLWKVVTLTSRKRVEQEPDSEETSTDA